MKVVPLGDKVVVRPIEAEAVTSGGVILPDVAQQQPQEGKVLSVGDGKLLTDGSRAGHEVNEGDRVLFNQYGATEVVVDGQALLIMAEDDILAVMH